MLNDSDFCMNPTKSQFALLYGGITLASIGLGGMRTNIATIGTNIATQRIRTCSSIGSSLLCTLEQ